MLSHRLRLATDAVLVAVEYSANAVFALLDPRLLTSGATPQEARSTLPGDSLVPWPSWEATRAVTIEAAPSRVWPWLVQAGYGRGGWYADMPWWRDPQGLRGRRSSADHLVREQQRLRTGQVLLDGPGCDETTGAWTVRAIHPEAALVLFSSRTPSGREVVPGSAPPRLYIDCSWAFVLRSLSGATRLLVRTRVSLHPDHGAVRWLTTGVARGDQATQRAMLFGIKRRVEDTTAETPRSGPGHNMRGNR